MKHVLQGIYGISNEALTPYEILSQCLESALKGGIKIFQLRDKSHSDEWLYERAKPLMELCEKYNGMECCECGSCTFICPAHRPLTQAFKEMRKSVAAAKRKKA